MSASPSKLVVLALPHSIMRAAFDYMAAVFATLPVGHGDLGGCELVTDPHYTPREGEVALYLRPEGALNALSLTRAASFPADESLIRAYALAEHCDRAWGHHFTLTLEDTVCREHAATIALSRLTGSSVDGAVLEAGRNGFLALQADLASLPNPAGFFAGMDDVPSRATESTAVSADQRVVDPPALQAAGFLPVSTGSSDSALSRLLEQAIQERFPSSVLIVADDVFAAVEANGRALTGRTLVGLSLGSATARERGATMILHQSLAEGPALPSLPRGGVGMAFLHNLAASPISPALLDWIFEAVEPGGMICGWESTAADLEPVLGALTRQRRQDGGVFTLDGSEWNAFRHNFQMV